MSNSLNEVLSFFDYAEQKGLMKPNTARSNKAVVARVAGVLDISEQGRIDQFSAEEIYARFKTKYAMELSPDSLRVYKSRFLSALSSFQKWKQGPDTYLSRQNQPSVLNVKSVKPAIIESGQRKVLPDIPVPLADGGIITIVGMPRDLTVEEAEKFKKIIESYVK